MFKTTMFQTQQIFRKKQIFALVLAFVFMVCLAIPSFALRENVTIRINETNFVQEKPLLIDSTTYVPLDAFRSFIGDFSQTPVEVSEDYISAMGRFIYKTQSRVVEDGIVYVPLRSIAKLYGCDISWDAATRTVSVTAKGNAIIPDTAVYNDTDLYWLSRIISAESRGEPLTGQIAVGNVIQNRVASQDFPDDIKSVIFDTKYSVQFTPVANNQIYEEPAQESIMAAKMCLEGYSVSDKIIYFIYEAIATNKWVVDNRTYELTIGCHDFYS